MSVVLFTDGLINIGDKFLAMYESFEDSNSTSTEMPPLGCYREYIY
jgi:hypothetical protein